MSTNSKKSTRKQSRPGKEDRGFEEKRTDVAGADIGAIEHFIAGRPGPDGTPNVRCFGTSTVELNFAVEWLKQQGITSIAMESTGVYWLPFYEILIFHGFEVLLVDSRLVRNITGRKTDVLDCQWIRKLHACSLLRSCFLPDSQTTALRNLWRMRQTLSHQQDDWIRRIQKQFDLMNIRVHRAVSDITGVTGMAIIRAILNGERDPRKLAQLRDHRCRKSEDEIVQELTGNWREEHLINLRVAVEMYDSLDRLIENQDKNIMRVLEQLYVLRKQAGEFTLDVVPPHSSEEKGARLIKRGEEALRVQLARTFGVDLTELEGIGAEVAATIFMELGPHITKQFPSEERFASYLKVVPKRGISGGHLVQSKGRSQAKGRSPVTRALLTAASAVRESDSPLGYFYRKTSYRKGAGVGVFATAHKIALRVYRALEHGIDLVKKQDEKWAEADLERKRAKLIRQAYELGLDVSAPSKAKVA